MTVFPLHTGSSSCLACCPGQLRTQVTLAGGEEAPVSSRGAWDIGQGSEKLDKAGACLPAARFGPCGGGSGDPQSGDLEVWARGRRAQPVTRGRPVRMRSSRVVAVTGGEAGHPECGSPPRRPPSAQWVLARHLAKASLWSHQPLRGRGDLQPGAL